jgi:hypothetical protein
MLSVIMLNVVMLSAVAPTFKVEFSALFFVNFICKFGGFGGLVFNFKLGHFAADQWPVL